ncbi:MAG: GDSL-type esterase/lipase family protein [Chloroflexota bacterium]
MATRSSTIAADEPDVTAQLAALCASGGRVTRLAQDGAQIHEIPAQLEGLPDGATHLVISVGGNDLLGQTSLLYGRVETVAEAMLLIAHAVANFRADYEQMLGTAIATGLPIVVCTIYNPAEVDDEERTISKTSIALFNDAIIQVAGSHAIPVIDLRAVCDDWEDFANPIEPSAIGGEKIAVAFYQVMTAHSFEGSHTVIYRD